MRRPARDDDHVGRDFLNRHNLGIAAFRDEAATVGKRLQFRAAVASTLCSTHVEGENEWVAIHPRSASQQEALDE